jgi:hypothetical protein
LLSVSAQEKLALSKTISNTLRYYDGRNDANLSFSYEFMGRDYADHSEFVKAVESTPYSDMVVYALAHDSRRRLDVSVFGKKKKDESNEHGEISSMSWSDERAANGEPFLLGSDGSIDLVELPSDVFEKMGIKKVPFRLTPSMIKHVYERHKKELGLKSHQDAVALILDVMNNFDHVRKGDSDSEYWFTIEADRTSIGKRAITILLNMDGGEWLGIKTVGYDRVANINKREMLWEKGANETSATGTVPANVTSGQPINDAKASGGASNQSISIGKGNTSPDEIQVSDKKN